MSNFSELDAVTYGNEVAELELKQLRTIAAELAVALEECRDVAGIEVLGTDLFERVHFRLARFNQIKEGERHDLG